MDEESYSERCIANNYWTVSVIIILWGMSHIVIYNPKTNNKRRRGLGMRQAIMKLMALPTINCFNVNKLHVLRST